MPHSNDIWKVVSPIGRSRSAQVTPLSPRLSDLNSKTVCQVWNGRFQADKIFSTLGELLRQRFPDVRIVPCTDLPAVSFYRDQDATLDSLREAYLQRGCDAVIAATGG